MSQRYDQKQNKSQETESDSQLWNNEKIIFLNSVLVKRVGQLQDQISVSHNVY